MAYVYRHVRLDKNEVFYIGIGLKEDDYKRAYSKDSRRSQHWKSIVKSAPYRVDIMFEDDDVELIKQKEIEFIALYGRRDLGLGTLVNFTSGGDGMLGYKHSEDSKRKLSEDRVGDKNPNWGKTPSEETIRKGIESRKWYEHSDETREKLRASKLGENNPNYGKSPSDETREKLRIASSSKKHSEETKHKMSETRKGELSHFYGKCGELSYNWGRKHSDETKKLMSDAKKGKGVGGENPNSRLVLNKETGIIYYSSIDALIALSLKVSRSHFQSMLLGKYKNKTPCIYI